MVKLKYCVDCEERIGMIKCASCKKNICHKCAYHYRKDHLCKECMYLVNSAILCKQ